MTDVNLFGTKLRELRGERSLYEVAKAMGIERGQLKRYEDGRIPEHQKTVILLSEFYGTPYFELQALCFEAQYPRDTLIREALLWWLKTQS
jgi:transcriptional regulator with XRE-family HTH domain